MESSVIGPRTAAVDPNSMAHNRPGRWPEHAPRAGASPVERSASGLGVSVAGRPSQRLCEPSRSRGAFGRDHWHVAPITTWCATDGDATAERVWFATRWRPSRRCRVSGFPKPRRGFLAGREAPSLGRPWATSRESRGDELFPQLPTGRCASGPTAKSHGTRSAGPRCRGGLVLRLAIRDAMGFPKGDP